MLSSSCDGFEWWPFVFRLVECENNHDIIVSVPDPECETQVCGSFVVREPPRTLVSAGSVA
jgi:hypothetical protein